MRLEINCDIILLRTISHFKVLSFQPVFFQIFQKQKEGEIQNRIFVRGLHTNFKNKVLGNNGSRSDGNNYWLHHIKSLIAGVK